MPDANRLTNMATKHRLLELGSTQVDEHEPVCDNAPSTCGPAHLSDMIHRLAKRLYRFIRRFVGSAQAGIGMPAHELVAL